MSEHEELIKQIEKSRLAMIKVKEGNSYSSPVVVAASQALDIILDKYQEMLMKKSEKK
jgi:hypothetical protein